MPRVQIPTDFLCPITHELMVDPVTTTAGDTYERSAIENWLTLHNTNPCDNTTLHSKILIPNKTLKKTINNFLEEKGVCTVEQFMEAVKSGDVERVKKVSCLDSYLHHHDKNKDAGGVAGNTVLHWSACHNHVEIASYLLKEGADINSKNDEGETPFCAAVRWGRMELVRLLFEKGCSIESSNIRNNSALAIAAHNGYMNIIKYLLERGSNIDSQAMDGSTPLMLAVWTNQLDAAKLLIEYKANTSCLNKDGSTAVHLAVRKSNEKMTQMLVSEAGVDIEIKDNDGFTPLHKAVQIGNANIVSILIRGGANIEAQCTIAVGEGKGGGVNQTALHLASWLGHESVVETLLKSKAQVDALDSKRWGPLHHAAYAGHLNIIKSLLHLGGANYKAMNDEGKTPSQVAGDCGRREIADLIPRLHKQMKNELPIKLTQLQQQVQRLTDENQQLREQMQMVLSHLNLNSSISTPLRSSSSNILSSSLSISSNSILNNNRQQ